jgi:hypothetical protein
LDNETSQNLGIGFEVRGNAGAVRHYRAVT